MGWSGLLFRSTWQNPFLHTETFVLNDQNLYETGNMSLKEKSQFEIFWGNCQQESISNVMAEYLTDFDEATNHFLRFPSKTSELISWGNIL